MVSDFAHLNNDGLVTRALSRLEKEGVLIRLSQGLYLYPLRNKFGVLRPSIEDIAYAIAEKDKARIIPSGLTALNKLGLSTQVTMNAVYLSGHDECSLFDRCYSKGTCYREPQNHIQAQRTSQFCLQDRLVPTYSRCHERIRER